LNTASEETDNLPATALVRFSLATMLMEKALLDEAAKSLAAALDIAPGFAAAHDKLGLILQCLGRREEAIAHYECAAKLSPGRPEFRNNLVSALAEQARHLLTVKDLAGAENTVIQALELTPDLVDLHQTLGEIYLARGEQQKAIEAFCTAVHYGPGNVRLWQSLLAHCQSSLSGKQLAALGKDLLTAYEQSPNESLADIATHLILARPEVSTLLSAAADNQQLLTLMFEGKLWPLLDDGLFLRVMESSLLCNWELEQLLTVLRKNLLLSHPTDTCYPADLAGYIPFLCSLAQLCFSNEYVFYVTGEEQTAVRQLQVFICDRIGSGSKIPLLRLVLLACYQPLHRLPECELLTSLVDAEDHHEMLQKVFLHQVVEPLAEQRMKCMIPAISPIDALSQQVQDQYEENPYPRWFSMALPVPLPMDKVFSKLFPHLVIPQILNNKQPAILIAGCGTGRHAITTAARFEGARVTAMDLSKASLAYAMRKAEEFGCANITFVQGDILNLDHTEQDFDIIECSGVLHHMASPEEGWRKLLRRLKPGGLMGVALYSTIARRHIAAARNFIAGRNYHPAPDDIRRCRREIASFTDDQLIRKVMASRDFYSTSACRDLIFHVQEHTFDLLQIAAIIKDFDLAFLGFQLDAQTLLRYSNRFPDDSTHNSLHLWHLFEQENPDTFGGMYQFWVQRSGK